MGKPTISNQKAEYQKSYNGSALDVLILSSSDPAAGSILARGQNFNYTRRFSISQVDEINTTHVQETNYGREELGNGTLATAFTLKNNDNLPSWEWIRSESELWILEVTGLDHPFPKIADAATTKPIVLHAFEGCRIVGDSGGTQVGQTKMMNIELVFRRRLSGAQYKKVVSTSVYLADVK
jgi:hypothetical protein